VGVRGAAAERRQPKDRVDAASVAVEGLVDLLARALQLESAAVTLERGAGERPALVAVHGRLPPESALHGNGSRFWSLTLPIEVRGRTAGRLLLARQGATPLRAADRALVRTVAAAAGRLLEHLELGAELERTRQLLARADRLSALGTLAAGLTHEIRNPLVSVRTFVQLLPERLHDPEFLGTFRELALTEVERICRLLNDLLAFSRPTPPQRDPTDLNDVVEQVTRLLDAEARREDVVLVRDLDPDLPPVVLDDGQIKQVLMNVLLNAIEASGAGGRVDVTTRVEGEPGERMCIVTVADSGPGIAGEHVDHVFDPFFTTKASGNGLGLFIARQIMAEHGGRIAPAPRDGGGTVFSIHLPADAGERGAGARAG
jgi:signal transduction histidine kinase